jgi:hypothetical protein
VQEGKRAQLSRAGTEKAQEKEIRGPEGMLGPCHDGGEASAGRRLDRHGARGGGPAGAS